MNARKWLLIGVSLGILLCTICFFLVLPLVIEENWPLWYFMIGIAVLSISICANLLRNNWIKLPNSNSRAHQENLTVKYRQPGMKLLFNLFALILMSTSVVLVLKKLGEIKEDKDAFQKEKIEALNETKEAVRRSPFVYYLSDVLRNLEAELNENPKRILRRQTIQRLAAVSDYFDPQSFEYLSIDTTKKRMYSPERGQLLMALLSYDIAAESLNEIYKSVSFAGAELKSAQLDSANLVGIDLMSANLANASLTMANLTNADLRGAHLWNANFNNAEMTAIQLNRSNMEWVDLNGANLDNADVKGANLKNAKVRNAHLKGADLQHAFLNGAILDYTDFSEANLFGSSLRKAQLNSAKFIKADLRRVDMSHTVIDSMDVTEAMFNKVEVFEENWIERLEGKGVIGAKELNENYSISFNKLKGSGYSLAKKNN